MSNVYVTWGPANDPLHPIDGQRRRWYQDNVLLSDDNTLSASISNATLSPAPMAHTYKCIINSRFEVDQSNPLTLVIVIDGMGMVTSTTVTPAASGGSVPPPTAGTITWNP